MGLRTPNEERRMANEIKLNRPWLVAVWPGMGQVAISAGYFLVAKLGMHILAEFSAHELFDVEHVEVKKGLIRTGRLPRSRFFVWKDPQASRDIVVFIGEAQPPKGRYPFCHRLIEFARQLGVERVYTFAALATPMRPEHPSRVFVAATDTESLDELKRLELEILEDGQIGGLNGVLLGVAAEGKLRGACLLGEMPHIFTQLPFPKASLSVLKAFCTIASVEIDLGEMAQQAKEVEQKLGALLEKVQEAIEDQQHDGGDDEEGGVQLEQPGEEEPTSDDVAQIERLFAQAQRDRSKAYELKRELDRLDLYKDYEDRFLDLFKKPE
jgi:proteasome assembly chaperone (PAC2) family protein